MQRSGDEGLMFDFELGDIVKSPCRDCLRYPAFPGCMPACKTLDGFQRMLTRSVSSVHYQSGEPYRLIRPERPPELS